MLKPNMPSKEFYYTLATVLIFKIAQMWFFAAITHTGPTYSGFWLYALFGKISFALVFGALTFFNIETISGFFFSGLFMGYILYIAWKNFRGKPVKRVETLLLKTGFAIMLVRIALVMACGLNELGRSLLSTIAFVVSQILRGGFLNAIMMILCIVSSILLIRFILRLMERIETKSDISGALFMMTIWMMLLYPLYSTILFSDSLGLLKSISRWQINGIEEYKIMLWLSFILFLALSFYGGAAFVRNRNKSTVVQGGLIIWALYPGQTIINGIVFPMIFVKRFDAGNLAEPYFVIPLVTGLLIAGGWTYYLNRSAKIRAVYTSQGPAYEGCYPGIAG